MWERTGLPDISWSLQWWGGNREIKSWPHALPSHLLPAHAPHWLRQWQCSLVMQSVSGEHGGLGVGREWIWRTNRNVSRTGWTSQHAGCNSSVERQSGVTQGYFGLSAFWHPALDEALLGFTSVCTTNPWIMHFLAILEMKNRLRKVACFDERQEKSSGTCFPNSRNLKWLFHLTSWEVTTETDWQSECYNDKVHRPAVPRDQENMAEITSTVNLHRQWTQSAVEAAMCLPLNQL